MRVFIPEPRKQAFAAGIGLKRTEPPAKDVRGGTGRTKGRPNGNERLAGTSSSSLQGDTPWT